MKLNASGNSGVVRWDSDFQQSCISKTCGLRTKHIHLNLYIIQFYVVIVCHLVKSAKTPGLLAYHVYSNEYFDRKHFRAMKTGGNLGFPRSPKPVSKYMSASDSRTIFSFQILRFFFFSLPLNLMGPKIQNTNILVQQFSSDSNQNIIRMSPWGNIGI